MSYELQFFSKTPEFSERICGWIGNPPPPHSPITMAGIFQSQIKGGRLLPTHAC